MNKKLIVTLAVLCTVAFCAPAFAAPQADVFSDVPSNHWSYKAVEKLAKDGIISVDTKRFEGDRGLTRYEMAVMVGNAMTKLEKADANQKAMIEKLSREYNAELVKLGARVAKVEAKAKVNFFFDNRIQYNYTSLGKDDKGKAFGGTGNIDQKGQFMERIRVYMNVPVGDQWEWNSRLVQAKWNFASPTGTDNFRFDRFWLTNKDFLGGQMEIGKMMLYPGKGSFYQSTGDIDGAYYTKTMDKWTARVGTGHSGGSSASKIEKNPWAGFPGQPDYVLVNSTTPASDVSFAELSYKPNKTSDIGVYVLQQDILPGFRDMEIRAINGAMEIPNTGGLALSFEYAKNKADDNKTYGFKGDQSGYFVALQSKYRATNYMPALYTQMVNPFVKGDSGWAVSYRHLPTGSAGFANRGAFAWVPLTTDKDGSWQNSYDGINAWRIDYITVPWKNVQWTLTYDHIKPIHKSTQGDWTNNSFQSTFNFFF